MLQMLYTQYGTHMPIALRNNNRSSKAERLSRVAQCFVRCQTLQPTFESFILTSVTSEQHSEGRQGNVRV